MAEPTPNLTPAQAHARRRLQHGMRYLEAGDLQAAGNALLQAVRLDDTLALAHYQLGNCLRRYGDNARAEQALLAAIENDAALNDAYISLAYLYHETGRDPDAGPILEKLLATRPDDVSLRFQLGGLIVKFGLFSDAERIDTASAWQARQPIYSASAGRRRHCRQQLQPLLRALDQ